MALQKYVVQYSTNNGVSYTDLTNIQSINLNVGVQAQLEQIKASTASVVLRYPTGYASPITGLKSGTWVRIRNNTNPLSIFTLWEGKIADVIVEYGILYSAGVGNTDFVTISAEGYFADIARMGGADYAMPAGTIVSQTDLASAETNVPIGYIPDTDGRLGAATTVSDTWGDWLARTALSHNARLQDGRQMTTGNVNIVSPFSIVACDYNFSDTPTGNDQKYDAINFDSLSDNYYTQVSVVTESFGTVTVTAAGATAPYRTYQVNTLNASVDQATDYANYLLSNYQTPLLALSSISATAEQQTNSKLDQMALFSVANYPGKSVNVTFRGTVYACIIEGVSMSATPSSTRFTFYVSGADYNNYLLLGDNTFGRLDFNKLGY